MRTYRCIFCISCLLSTAILSSAQTVALPPLAPEASSAINLLADGSFEAAEAGAWGFADWPPRPETSDRLIADSIRYTTEQAWDGESCLVFDLTTVGEGRTLIARQRFTADQLEPHDGSPMRISGRVLLGSGPTVQTVGLTLRQWSDEGLLSSEHLRMTADVNEWAFWSRDFVFRMGDTRRADVNVTIGQSPDLTKSPIVYLDDVRLEVLATAPLSAALPWGEALLSPEGMLPVEVLISEEAWAEGLRHLRWDLTSPDGLQSHGHEELAPPTRSIVLAVPPGDIIQGRYGVRVSLGREPGERTHEVLLPFTRAEGPFAR